MIELIFGGMIYGAQLISCYDGDTCRITLDKTNPLVNKQSIRFFGYDTPEIRGKCNSEKQKARKARSALLSYIQSGNRTWTVLDNSDKYGRIVVEVPGLASYMVELDLARYYDGGKRQGWCK